MAEGLVQLLSLRIRSNAHEFLSSLYDLCGWWSPRLCGIPYPSATSLSSLSLSLCYPLQPQGLPACTILVNCKASLFPFQFWERLPPLLISSARPPFGRPPPLPPGCNVIFK